MADYTWKQWENEQNEANNIHADDCYRWQAGIELAGGTWDGTWVDLDKTGKGLVTIDQFNALESQIQSKVSSYTPKNYDPDSTVQIVPGVDGWNKVENGIITALCKPDGTNVNIYPNSNTDVAFTAYGGTTYEVERNIVVEEWGATDANRFYGTGGTGNLVVYKRPDSLNAVVDQVYTFSVYIKNNSENGIRVAFNGPSTRVYSDYLAKGEQQKIVLTGIGESATANIQFQVLTYAVGDTFDFIWWHPKIELSDTATDWTPCPTDYGYPSTTLSVSATPQSVEDSDEVAAPEAEEIE